MAQKNVIDGYLANDMQDAQDNFTELYNTVDVHSSEIADKAQADHTHGAGGVIVSLAENYAALGDGATVGEKKTAQDSGLTYRWFGDAWLLDVDGFRVETLTDNRTVSKADGGKFFIANSGDYTVTFGIISELCEGFSCSIKNNGSGEIEVATSGSDTIDGLSTFVMYPYEHRFFYYDGTTLYSFIKQAFYKEYTESGTFTRPPGYAMISVGLVGSGNSGGKGASSGGLGGGGGGSFLAQIHPLDIGTTEDIIIGDGGAAKTTTGIGNLGGETSFGSCIAIHNSSGTYSHFGGSVVSGGLYGKVGGFGGSDDTFGSVYGGGQATTSGGRNSVYGGGGGGPYSGSSPGTSGFAGNGGAGHSTTDGEDGEYPGGGGGGTDTGSKSGAGAAGRVRIWGVL